MYRLWGKKIKNNQIVDSIVVEDKSNFSLDKKREFCINKICEHFDVSVPNWLSSHDLDFKTYKYVTFYQVDFVEDILFDRMEIELIDDGKKIKF